MNARYADIIAYNQRSFGQRTAITIDDRGVTHAGLADLVGKTRTLLGKYVGAGDRLAVWLPNSFAWVATFVAARSLGATVVPINTRLTAAEMAFVLEDSLPAAVVTTSEYRGRDYLAEALDCGFSSPVCISASDEIDPLDWRIIEAAATTNAARGSRTPTHLMLVQYTSGTTSAPKGVMLTEDAYLRTAGYCARAQRLTPSSRFMSATPFFHCSGSMHALSTCLLAGCSLHTMSVWDVEKFLHLVQTHGGDVGHGVFMRDVIAFGTEKARPYVNTLKTLNVTGSAHDLQRIHDELGVTGVSNLFGMTETCGNLTMWYPDDPLQDRISGNGRPQPGNCIRTADADTGEVLAHGEVGEIQVKGHTVSKGYYNRPDLTAEAFTGDGWLRTGDLGAVTAENGLVFKSRLKDMIRVGGENLAPAQIEQVIQEISGVDELCVVAQPHERLGEVPVIVTTRGAEIGWNIVLERARAQLAGYKIPRAVYQVAVFPRTITRRIQKSSVQRDLVDGKLNRIV